MSLSFHGNGVFCCFANQLCLSVVADSWVEGNTPGTTSSICLINGLSL